MALGNNMKKPDDHSNQSNDQEEITMEKHQQNGNGSESQRMKAILEAVDSSYAFIEFDTVGNILSANSNFLSVMGYSLEQIKGKHHRMFVQPEHANSPEYKLFWEDLRRGRVQSGEFRRMDASHHDIWLQATYSPVKESDGKVVKIVKIATDITQEKTSSINAQGLKATVDASFAQIEFDTKGTILDANMNFVRTLGYSSPKEIIGNHHSMFVDAEYRSSMEYRHFWEQLANGVNQEGQFRRINKTGKDIWIQGVYTAVKDSEGKVAKVIKIASDITEQMLANINMAALKSTIDASFAEIEFDPTGKILDVNDNFVRTLGYNNAKDLIGNHHSMFVDAEYKRSVDYKRFWEDLANGITQEGQFTRVGRDGNKVWIQAAYTPAKDKMGKVFKVIKIATDITAQKQEDIDAEKASAEIMRVITAIAAGDLTQRFSIETTDKFTGFANSLNTATENLNGLLNNISQIANLVASSAEELLTKGEQMKNTTQEVASATQQMAEGAQQQAQQTDESSKLIDGVLKSANEMGKKAEVINVAAERGQKSASDGLSTIRKVVENMSEILNSASATSNSINVLAQRSEEIASTLSVITDIASQTNLLALNAAIEAARAGEAGRGFAVVAEEIRKLAEGSRKSAIDIEKVVKEVQKDITSAGRSIETMEVSVKSGNTASKEAEIVFQNIEKTSAETLDLSKEIVDATSTQKESINSTVKNIEKIVVVAEETASGTEQIASSGKELSQGMNEVTATSKDLADVANQLQDSISKFKLK